MDLKSILDVAVRVLTVAKTFTGENKWIVTVLGLVTSLQSSPDMIAWLEKLFANTASMPPGALAVAVSPDDAELTAAYNASPAVREWAMTQKPESVPSDAEAIGVGSVLTFIKFLPELIALLKALKGK